MGARQTVEMIKVQVMNRTFDFSLMSCGDILVNNFCCVRDFAKHNRCQ